MFECPWADWLSENYEASCAYEQSRLDTLEEEGFNKLYRLGWAAGFSGLVDTKYFKGDESYYNGFQLGQAERLDMNTYVNFDIEDVISSE